MLLLVFASLWVLVSKDKVDLTIVSRDIFDGNVNSWTNLVGGTALVGTKHDNVGRGVGELFGVKCAIVLEELHVCTSTLETACIESVTLHG